MSQVTAAFKELCKIIIKNLYLIKNSHKLNFEHYAKKEILLILYSEIPEKCFIQSHNFFYILLHVKGLNNQENIYNSYFYGSKIVLNDIHGSEATYTRYSY